jgi:hypothetical protein
LKDGEAEIVTQRVISILRDHTIGAHA